MLFWLSVPSTWLKKLSCNLVSLCLLKWPLFRTECFSLFIPNATNRLFSVLCAFSIFPYRTYMKSYSCTFLISVIIINWFLNLFNVFDWIGNRLQGYCTNEITARILIHISLCRFGLFTDCIVFFPIVFYFFRVIAKLGGQLLLISRIFSQKRQNCGTHFSSYNHSLYLKLALVHSFEFDLCTRRFFIYFRVCLHIRNGTAVSNLTSLF